MKKLFALVMVLAMALAIAVPAMASGWDQIPETAATLKDITVAITALEVDPNTSVLGSLYEQLSVMYPVVKGTDVHFLVEVTIPKEANLSAANWKLLDTKGLVYDLTISDNLDLTKMNTYVDNGTATPVASPFLTTKTFGQADVGHVYGFEYFAEGNAAGDATATATIGFYNTWDVAGTSFGWDNDADGTNEYTVITNGTTVADITTFTVWQDQTVGSEDNYVFPVDEGKIDTTVEMTMYVAGANFAINRAVNGDITFRALDAKLVAAGTVITPADTTNYPTLKTAFDSYFTALGFGYADAKYMTQAHFETYFGTIAETSAKITYPSGTVVVTEPTVNPPQTGDASTVVGFVMIALALVAAAAVTVKKVRA